MNGSRRDDRTRVRRPVRRVGTVLLVPLLVVLSLTRHAAATPSADTARDLVGALEAATNDHATVAKNAASGRVSFVGTTPEHPFPRAPGVPRSATAEAAARGFLREYGAIFGIEDEAAELRALPPRPGSRAVHFEQLVQGVPVIAGELAVDVLSDGSVLSVNGETTPHVPSAVTPSVTSRAAATIAVEASAHAQDVRPAALHAADPVLSVYDRRLLGGPGPDGSTLVWRTAVTSSDTTEVDDYVLVDAQTGDVALRYSQIETAKDRRVCDHMNVRDNSPCTGPYARSEGQGPTGVNDVDKAYDYAGATYDFYSSRFGRDSINGAGLPLVNTVRFCFVDPSRACPWRNAQWNGAQMLYGDGFAAADDVVGHELTHGVTQYESNLAYYFQSGAINESLSDVFGEFVDLTDGLGNDGSGVRWQLGEDLPIGAIRSMSNPPTYFDPDRTGSTLYTADGSFTDNGGVHTNSGVNNKAAYLIVDGDTFNGHTVVGIGVDKAARIYYKASVDLLTSGSDYSDLGNALQQSCVSLVGQAGITSANCTSVREAVLATEMNLSPRNAPAPDAPVCAAGEVPTNLFSDNFENASSGNWSFTPSSGGGRFQYVTNWYATSGTGSAFADDPAVVSDGTMTRAANVVPPPGSTTYLHFSHAYDSYALDANGVRQYSRDGGRVEYSTNNGSTWSDAGPLFTDVGYNGNSPAWGGNAFTGISNGFRSSRVDLTSLAGQSVRLRFHYKSDASLAGGGWWIDDVSVYTCAPPAPAVGGLKLVSADAKNPSVAFNGTNYLVAWEATHDGSGDPDVFAARVTPSGTVLDPSGIQVSTASVNEQHPSVASDGSNFFVVWEDARNGALDLYGTRISGSGTVLNTGGIPISTATNTQRNPAVAFNGANYLVAWEDLRTGGANIYATRVSPNGAVLDGTGIGVSTLAAAEQEPSVASNGSDFLVAWTDYRNGSPIPLPRIVAARVNAVGTLLDASGIPVSGTNNGTQSTVAFNGTNYLAAWTGGSGITGARISSAGAVLDATLLPISTAPNDQGTPDAARLGNDVLVVWRDRRWGGDYDLYGGRVASTGAVKDPYGFLVSNDSSADGPPDIADRGGSPAVNGVVYDVIDPSLLARTFLRNVTAPK